MGEGRRVAALLGICALAVTAFLWKATMEAKPLTVQQARHSPQAGLRVQAVDDWGDATFELLRAEEPQDAATTSHGANWSSADEAQLSGTQPEEATTMTSAAKNNDSRTIEAASDSRESTHEAPLQGAGAPTATATGPDEEGVLRHYASVARMYNGAWFERPETGYNVWLAKQVEVLLELERTSRVLDLGAGTGGFSAALHEVANLSTPVLAVDASPEMLDSAERLRPQVGPMVSDALNFSQNASFTYDRVVIKDAAHHMAKPVNHLTSVLRGVSGQLSGDGPVVILARPRNSSHLPLFPRAHAAWYETHADEATYTDALTGAGLGNISVHYTERDVRMPVSEWVGMVRRRYWSALRGVGEDEIEQGVEEMRQALGVKRWEEKRAEVRFIDRWVCIVARKSGHTAIGVNTTNHDRRSSS